MLYDVQVDTIVIPTKGEERCSGRRIKHMAMTLRLTPEQDQALTLLAQLRGVSKQEAATRAIVETAARTVRTSEVRDLARRDVAEYRAVENRVRRDRG